MSIRVHPWLNFGVYLFVPIFLSQLTFSSAQQVLAPRPPEYSPPTNAVIMNGLPIFTNQLEVINTNETSGLNSLGAAASASEAQRSTLNAQPRLFDLGPVQLRPHFFYRFSYGDGIQPEPGHKKVTAVNEISPGVLLDIGNHWHLDYTPTLRYYSNKAFRDGFDNAANLSWGTAWRDWVLGFSQAYASSSTPLAETGAQTDQETYTTGINGVYQLNNKISLDFSINQNFRYVNSVTTNQPLSDSRTWSTTEGLNYRFWPGFSVGLSVTFTYDDVTVSPDMTSEQIQGRLNWQPGPKLMFAFSGGFEDRQFLNSNVPDSVSPIFNLSAIYHLFEVTTLTLTANSSVSASYFQSQITDTTGFNASLQQRLLQKLTLTVSGGFGNSSYSGTTAFASSVNRQDNHSNIDVRLTCPFLTRGTASVFYDWTDHSSNEKGFQYNSNQFGFDLGYRY